MIFKKGDRVRVIFEGGTEAGAVATVFMASGNGRSLALEFRDLVVPGGGVAAMPVLDEDGTGEFRDIINGMRLKLVPHFDA